MNCFGKGDDDYGDDDLGLNLSLQLKCPEISSPPHPHLPFKQQKPSLNGVAFLSSSSASRSDPQEIDVNELPTIDPEAVAIVSSPNSTLSNASGKRSDKEENEQERNSVTSHGIGDDGDDSSIRKKLRLSKEQAAVLEETFKRQVTLSLNEKAALAKQLDLQARQVEVWFQNRRARTKLKKTEVDFHYLKRHCENLKEENRRLQNEVNELRALKFPPQATHLNNMKQPAATILSMCPQCQRVSIVPKSSPVGVTASNPPIVMSGSGIVYPLVPVGPADAKYSTSVNSWPFKRPRT